MIAGVGETESGVVYHPEDVGKLLFGLGFSVQRSRRVGAASAAAGRIARLVTAIYPSTNVHPSSRVLILTGDVTFRQVSNLHATWSRPGHLPRSLSQANERARSLWAGSYLGAPASTLSKPRSSRLPSA